MKKILLVMITIIMGISLIGCSQEHKSDNSLHYTYSGLNFNVMFEGDELDDKTITVITNVKIDEGDEHDWYGNYSYDIQTGNVEKIVVFDNGSLLIETTDGDTVLFNSYEALIFD